MSILFFRRLLMNLLLKNQNCCRKTWLPLDKADKNWVRELAEISNRGISFQLEEIQLTAEEAVGTEWLQWTQAMYSEFIPFKCTKDLFKMQTPPNWTKPGNPPA